jgi:hypothetical protein
VDDELQLQSSVVIGDGRGLFTVTGIANIGSFMHCDVGWLHLGSCHIALVSFTTTTPTTTTVSPTITSHVKYQWHRVQRCHHRSAAIEDIRLSIAS